MTERWLKVFWESLFRFTVFRAQEARLVHGEMIAVQLEEKKESENASAIYVSEDVLSTPYARKWLPSS